MKKIKSEKGITLVALIITIIVLLILAVVAIRAVQGDGILQYAKNSADKHQAGVEKENAMLGNYLAKLEENIPGAQGETIPTGEAIGTAGNTIRIGDLVYVATDEQYASVYGYRDGVTDYTNVFNLVLQAPNVTSTELQIASKVKIGEKVYIVNSISENAFYGGMPGQGATTIISITIPNTVTTIENDAFNGCTNLVSISLPEAITTIGNRAFYGCTNLATISIPNTVTNIGYQAFNGTNWLSTQQGNRADRLVIVGDEILIDGTTSIDETLTIPNNVKTIIAGAFYGNTNIKELRISSNVKNVTIYNTNPIMGPFINWGTDQVIKVWWEEGNLPTGWNENWTYPGSLTIEYGYTAE